MGALARSRTLPGLLKISRFNHHKEASNRVGDGAVSIAVPASVCVGAVDGEEALDPTWSGREDMILTEGN